MSIQEIKAEMECLPVDERRQLAAFLVFLRHKDMEQYRADLTKKIDDKNPENWVSFEEFDRRLNS